MNSIYQRQAVFVQPDGDRTHFYQGERLLLSGTHEEAPTIRRSLSAAGYATIDLPLGASRETATRAYLLSFVGTTKLPPRLLLSFELQHLHTVIYLDGNLDEVLNEGFDDMDGSIGDALELGDLAALHLGDMSCVVHPEYDPQTTPPVQHPHPDVFDADVETVRQYLRTDEGRQFIGFHLRYAA